MSGVDPPTPGPGQPQPSKRVLPVRPPRTAAVEAGARVGEPLSALLLYDVLGRRADFPTVAHHLVRFADEGVLVGRQGWAPGGPVEHLYLLAA